MGQITPIVVYEDNISPAQISTLDSAQLVDVNGDMAMINNLAQVSGDEGGWDQAIHDKFNTLSSSGDMEWGRQIFKYYEQNKSNAAFIESFEDVLSQILSHANNLSPGLAWIIMDSVTGRIHRDWMF